MSNDSTTELTREYQRHWTPVHLDFKVADVSAIVAHATRAGARIESEIQSYSWGRLAVLSDPFGHGFCVLQFLRGGYDRVIDRQTSPNE